MYRNEYLNKFEVRRNEILEFYKSHTKVETAEKFKISQTRVAQIVKKYGKK